MKKNKEILVLGLFILLGIFLANFVSAEPCSLSVNLVNQDPYPAIPGDYVDLVFQVSGVENPNCVGAVFELIPSYPFSIDSDDNYKVLEGSTYVQGYKTDWMIPYMLRVDEDALDGISEVVVKYGQTNTAISKEFEVTIQDSRTDFDSVIQEYSDSEVSIALANVGKYSANSVVIRIPDQDDFMVTGTDGQMIGNLDAGDYTIVSFSVSMISQQGMRPRDTNENVSFENQNTNFEFDVYYTDELGERRVTNMNLPLNMGSSVSVNSDFPGIPGDFNGREMKKTNSFSLWYTLAVILILIFVLLFVYKKYSRKIDEKFNLFFKKKKKDSSPGIPDWMNKLREKENKK